MKKLIAAILLGMLLVAPAWAFKRFPDDANYGVPTAKNSGVKTADTGILAGAGIFYGLVVVTDGTNACTVSVYDAVSATGTKFFPTVIVPASSTSGYAISLGYGILASTGIFVDITSAGTCSFSSYYDY